VGEERRMSLTLEQWLGLLTAVAAWVALGLSLYNRWQSRERQRVEASLGLMPQQMLAENIRVIMVKFINERGPVVVIEEVGLEYADGRHAIAFRPPGDKLPTTVPPGHSARYYYPLERWREAVQAGNPMPIRFWCRDATGRRYETRLSQAIRDAVLE